MVKKALIIIAALVLAVSPEVCQAKREKFKERPVVYKGEHIVGLGINYLNIGTENLGILQVITNIDAKGSILKVAPQYAYAFKTNQTIGVRLNYTDIQGGADNLSIDLLGLLDKMEGISLDIHSRNMGATLFHRRYFGLDKKGNVGFYLESGLTYKNTWSAMNSGEGDGYTKGHQVHLHLSPGFIIYIAANASLNMQLGIVNVNYKNTSAYKGGECTGSLGKLSGGVGLNVMDLLFGVTYHF